MTMHDESNLQLLEGDLQALAKEQENDERLRLALRRQLAERLQPRSSRRLSRRIGFGLAAAAAAALAAIAALVGTGGSGGPGLANAAIIHHAIKAVSCPANRILHVKVVGVQNGVAIAGETWQETSAPYADRGIKGEVGHQGEAAENGTITSQYDPGTNTIYEQPDSSSPTFNDPLSQVRKELAKGAAQVDGSVVIDGVSLYKISLPNGLVGYFDKNDYMPRYLDDPQRDGGDVVRLRVAAYEYLPMTPANRALLSISAQHPGARIDTKPADALSGK